MKIHYPSTCKPSLRAFVSGPTLEFTIKMFLNFIHAFLLFESLSNVFLFLCPAHFG